MSIATEINETSTFFWLTPEADSNVAMTFEQFKTMASAYSQIVQTSFAVPCMTTFCAYTQNFTVQPGGSTINKGNLIAENDNFETMNEELFNNAASIQIKVAPTNQKTDNMAAAQFKDATPGYGRFYAIAEDINVHETIYLPMNKLYPKL